MDGKLHQGIALFGLFEIRNLFVSAVSMLPYKRKKADREAHLLSTMKTKYYFLAKKSLTVVESTTASLNV